MGSQLKKSPLQATKSICICTRHFCEEDFVLNPKEPSGRPLKKRKLTDGAVPTLYMVPEPTPKTPPAHRMTKKSIESLEFEKQDLLACIADLKKKNQLQKGIMENNEKEIKEMSAKGKINASKTLKSLDDKKKQVKLLTSLLNKTK